MSNARRTPTISEVASASHVSKTTISRYLNGRYEYMSTETRERIANTIEELGYRPNHHARSLKSDKSWLIGVMVSDITSPFSSILIKGIGDFFTNKGYHIIVANSDDDPVKEENYIRALIDQRVDGIIVNTTGGNDRFLLNMFDQGMPIVLADRAIALEGLDTVVSDNWKMTSAVVEELLQSGYGRVALFSQPIEPNGSRMTRRDAYMDVCIKHALKPEIHVVDIEDDESVRAALLKFIGAPESLRSGPPAVLAVNGVTLLSVVRQVMELGIEMPTQIGVVGHDDWAWASLIPPGITAIAQPTYEIGREAAKLLLSRFSLKRKRKARTIEVPSQLVRRGSSKLK